jgi:hypothetical protein
MGVRHFTIKDPAMWYQPGDEQIFHGDGFTKTRSALSQQAHTSMSQLVAQRNRFGINQR